MALKSILELALKSTFESTLKSKPKSTLKSTLHTLFYYSIFYSIILHFVLLFYTSFYYFTLRSIILYFVLSFHYLFYYIYVVYYYYSTFTTKYLTVRDYFLNFFLHFYMLFYIYILAMSSKSGSVHIWYGLFFITMHIQCFPRLAGEINYRFVYFNLLMLLYFKILTLLQLFSQLFLASLYVILCGHSLYVKPLIKCLLNLNSFTVTLKCYLLNILCLLFYTFRQPIKHLHQP